MRIREKLLLSVSIAAALGIIVAASVVSGQPVNLNSTMVSPVPALAAGSDSAAVLLARFSHSPGMRGFSRYRGFAWGYPFYGGPSHNPYYGGYYGSYYGTQGYGPGTQVCEWNGYSYTCYGSDADVE